MSAGDIIVTRMGACFRGRRFPCTIGRGGVTGAKREGDGATPRGIHSIGSVLYRPDRIVRPTGRAVPVRPRSLWSDDPDDPDYNGPVQDPHSFSHERLFRADRLYDLIVVIDWNRPGAVPGNGSAIFLHRWRRPGHPTAGCVAFRPRDLRWIARRIGPATRLIVR